MRIQRIGSSPLKGGRHASHEAAEFGLDGPVGDRVFAVVDLERGRVLKTVEHPALMSCEAHWTDGVLSIVIGGWPFTARPEPAGRQRELDYWGRPAPVEVVDGPWAAAFSALLGREVALARASRAGAVVFGESVTVVTTSSLRRLSRETGGEVDARRFRSNLVIDTGDADDHVEDSWAGRELAVGDIRLQVADGIPRCAVIDMHPDSGASGSRLLTTLAGYRHDAGEIPFGVYARVTRPGVVSRGDEVHLLRALA